jgi:hypothetical protein
MTIRVLCFSLFLLSFCSHIQSVDYFSPTRFGSCAFSKGVGALGFDDSAVSVFENPASLTRIQTSSISAFQTTVMSDTFYKNLAVALRLGKRQSLSVGFAELSTDDIPKTQLYINPLYSQEEIIAVSSYRYANQRLALGWQFQYLETVSF